MCVSALRTLTSLKTLTILITSLKTLKTLITTLKTLKTLITSLKHSQNTHITQTLKHSQNTSDPNHSGYLNRIDRMMWKEEMMEYSAATTPCRLM